MTTFPVRFKSGHQVRHLSKRGLVLNVTVMTFVWLLTGAHFLFFFANPHAFEHHLHLVNRTDLETILQVEVFMNKGDLQVRATHKILRYDPIQKSFAALKYVIKAKDPQLQRITVAEHGFFLPKGSSAQGGVTLAGSSLS